MMDDEYVQESLSYRWPFVPIKVWCWFVKWFGGHYVSDDR